MNYSRLRDLLELVIKTAPFWEGHVDVVDLLAWVAVQTHSGGDTDSTTRAGNRHKDSLLRIINIGITLQNSRQLWVAPPNETRWKKNRTAINIPQGSVYVAAPTAFEHQPEFAKIDIKEQSIALQMSPSLPPQCIKLCTLKVLTALEEVTSEWLRTVNPTSSDCARELCMNQTTYAEMRFEGKQRLREPRGERWPRK